MSSRRPRQSEPGRIPPQLILVVFIWLLQNAELLDLGVSAFFVYGPRTRKAPSARCSARGNSRYFHAVLSSPSSRFLPASPGACFLVLSRVRGLGRAGRFHARYGYAAEIK